MAPAPPPAPGTAVSASSQGGGFNPSGTGVLFEMLLALGAVLASGALFFFAGGWLASWLTPLVPWKVDQRLGESAMEQATLGGECENPALRQYVEEVAAPLIAEAGSLPFEFRFRISSSEEINAFSLPGGYVIINYGLIQAANSGEEVAGVIGHEMQHAMLRHSTKRSLRQLGGRAMLSLLFGGSEVQSLGEAAGGLTGLAFDRDQELEADEQGVELMVKAGVDPRGLSTIFQRLDNGQERPPAFLATHPDPGDRARHVHQAAVGRSFRRLPKPEGLTCHLD